MPAYYFDCYHYNGYTGCCGIKGGDCSRKCKDFITEGAYYDQFDENDLRISLAHLRDILTAELGGKETDKLINKIKREI